MESVQEFKSIPRPKLVAPKPVTYVGDIDDTNHKNYFLNYNVIKDSLKKGLHPKYLSCVEKEVMVAKEGGGWYDAWALLND